MRQRLAEADRSLAAGSRREIRSCAAHDRFRAARDRRCASRQIQDRLSHDGDVTVLSGREFQLQRPPLLIEARADIVRKSSSRTWRPISTSLAAITSTASARSYEHRVTRRHNPLRRSLPTPTLRHQRQIEAYAEHSKRASTQHPRKRRSTLVRPDTPS